MEKKRRSLHEIVQGAGSLSSEELQAQRKLDRRSDLMKMKYGSEVGMDKKPGVHGVSYPLKEVLADKENPEDPGIPLEPTDEVEDTGDLNPTDWD
jgi:hypothetical protein